MESVRSKFNLVDSQTFLRYKVSHFNTEEELRYRGVLAGGILKRIRPWLCWTTG